MHIDWQALLGGAAVYGILAYAARTIPQVENRWGRWLIGVVQYALSNSDLGKQALKQ